MRNHNPSPTARQFVLPTLLGMFVGSIVALLFAPTVEEQQNAIAEVKEQIQTNCHPTLCKRALRKVDKLRGDAKKS